MEVCLAAAVKGIKNDKDKLKHFSKRKREKTRQVASKSNPAGNVGAESETRYTANGIVGGFYRINAVRKHELPSGHRITAGAKWPRSAVNIVLLRPNRL
jgi:hypothetical protein